MSETRTLSRPSVGYEADFYAWTQQQAEQLRSLRPSSIDWENVAEEIESLGGSQRREIRSRPIVLLTHLLKWAYQPSGRGNSWRASIVGAREEVLSELQDSLSLRRYPAEVLPMQYKVARLEASGETRLDLSAFPESCPFTIDEVLDPSFWPETPKP